MSDLELTIIVYCGATTISKLSETMDINRDTEPVYFKHKELETYINNKVIALSLYREITTIIPESVKCVQQFSGVLKHFYKK